MAMAEEILKMAPEAKKGKKSKYIGMDFQKSDHDFCMICILDTLNCIMALKMDIVENIMHMAGVKGRYKVFPCKSDTLKFDIWLQLRSMWPLNINHICQIS